MKFFLNWRLNKPTLISIAVFTVKNLLIFRFSKRSSLTWKFFWGKKISSPVKKNYRCQNYHGLKWLCSRENPPGPDGLPKEFYAKFWEILGPHLLDLYNFSFELGCFTESMQSSITRVIRKVRENHSKIGVLFFY